MAQKVGDARLVRGLDTDLEFLRDTREYHCSLMPATAEGFTFREGGVTRALRRSLSRALTNARSAATRRSRVLALRVQRAWNVVHFAVAHVEPSLGRRTWRSLLVQTRAYIDSDAGEPIFCSGVAGILPARMTPSFGIATGSYSEARRSDTFDHTLVNIADLHQALVPFARSGEEASAIQGPRCRCVRPRGIPESA